MEKRFIISILVENKYGVLMRVTSMFTRRGFNIDSLSVGITESPEYSRITITMTGDEYAKQQMVSQLRKLYNVKKVDVLEDAEAVRRELILVKVRNDLDNHQRLLASLDIFKANILHYSTEVLSIECTGSPNKIDAFIEMVRPLGIIELCRTGMVAMHKGKEGVISNIEQ